MQRRVLKIGGRKLHISDTGDYVAQNSDFVPKFPQNGRFSAPNFVFLEKSKQKFSDRLKFGVGQLPSSVPRTTPVMQCHSIKYPYTSTSASAFKRHLKTFQSAAAFFYPGRHVPALTARVYDSANLTDIFVRSVNVALLGMTARVI